MSGDVRRHYDDLADTYDENWTYSSEYVRWMASCIVDALNLAPEDQIVDIGCGTGLYAREVAELVKPRLPLQCADPSAGMLKQLPPSPDLLPLQASAEDLAEGRVRLPHAPIDAAWMKEAVHHIEDRHRTLAGFAALLAPGGRLLIVMLPATIQYPLFDAALLHYEELQPDPAEIARHLTEAGLQTDLTYVEYPLTIDKDRYLRMVRARYMSLLSMFTDAELEAGITEISAKYPGPELHFPDRFAFVLGRRTERSASSSSEAPGSPR